MTKKTCDGVLKVERKTVEKNRRLKMKNLSFRLSSLIPRQTGLSKETSTQQDHLEEATVYIKKLQEIIEKLKRKKEMGVVIDENPDGIDGSEEIRSSETPAIVEIRELENSISEVLVICGRNKRFVLYDVVSIVEKEGAEVISASTSTVGTNVCYTIHSQVASTICSLMAGQHSSEETVARRVVREIMVPRIGLDVSRLEEKLRKLVN